jgi:hypothetical protein
MTRLNKVIVTSSLHNVGDRSAIDLKIENYVPSEVRDPHDDQTSARLSGGAPIGDYANENKNQKECVGRGVSWLHRPDATLRTRSWRARRSSTCGSLQVHWPGAVRPCRPAHLPQLSRGQAHPGWAQINESRIPRRSIYIGPPRLDVHCCRSGPGIPCVWYLGHG